MIVAGFGFRQSASLASLQSALEGATGAMIAVDALATIDRKAGQLAPLARHLALPLIAVSVESLSDQPVLTRSPASMAAYGAGSVAEAAALAALRPKGRLLAPRALSSDRRASCAIAEGPDE